MEINDIDLKQNQYDICILEENVTRLSKIALLTHQTLTAEFCAKHLLHKKLDDYDDEDNDINILDVLKCQPHISRQKLVEACKNLLKSQ